jgi:hypothetical protein
MLGVTEAPPALGWQLAPGKSDDDELGDAPRAGRRAESAETLPYRVEVWDAKGQELVFVSSISASSAVAHAAFYAAAKENHDRQVVLTYQGRVLNRWPQSSH